MSEPGVDVVWSSLNRAWRKAGHDELWLQFRPRGSKDVLAEVAASVQVANQKVAELGWGDVVFTQGVSDSDAGPVALMSRAGSEEAVRAWFGAFADHLQSLGKSGKVTAAPTAFFPDWLHGVIEIPRQLTAFVSYRTNDLSDLSEPQVRAGWHVPAPLTGRITEAAATWGQFPGADVYLRRDIHRIRTKNPDVGRPLADGVIKFALAGVTYLRSEPRKMISLNLAPQGQACYEVMDDTASWQDRLEKVRTAMVAFPHDTELAFLRYSSYYTPTWSDLSNGRPPLPYVRESQIRYNKHLNSQYTPDAHGIQILTDAHLKHATDLSDWVIKPLGGGRHLVQAKDLEPWYATTTVDPQTLANARADFGAVILTPEIVANNPPPWIPWAP